MTNLKDYGLVDRTGFPICYTGLPEVQREKSCRRNKNLCRYKRNIIELHHAQTTRSCEKENKETATANFFARYA